MLFVTWGYAHREDAPSHLAFVADVLGLVVPALFLAGLAGLYARCQGRAGFFGGIGFVLCSVGSGLGVVNHFETLYVPMRTYVVDARDWSLMLLIWLTWVLAGLTLVGVVLVGRKGLGSWGALALAMGLLGWVYYLTDSNSLVEAGSVHVAFGVLFGASWVVLGYALLRSGRAP